VIVAALEGHAARADEVHQRLVRAWSSHIPCGFTNVGAAELQLDALQNIDAIVLVADTSARQSTTLAILESVSEAGLPVLALLDSKPEGDNSFEFAGAMVERWDVADDRLCALLTGMLHRQQDIKRLRAEMTLNQRFNGGLKGEIAKMHEELQLAALVQREFLPREMPSMHGIEFAALWRPSNYVSGDIYDLIRLDEDHIGIFVADAVGHGVPAALMTMVICRSLTCKEITGNSYRLVPPSEVLARLNVEMIRRQGRSTRFATAVYGLIDCRRRVLQLAGAGHPPPVRLCSSGRSEVLQTTGGLLGVFPDETYEQIDVDLALGDRLLFYTDGFEQAFPAAQTNDAYQRRLPSTRYRSEFDQLRLLPSAADMIEAISRRLDDQTGSLHQIDDLTLVCVHAGTLAPAGDANSCEPENIATPSGGDEIRAGNLRLAS
jgi:serine phosphatase RsbU (regulator of sigma subunit)